jgi:hypothetical protein
MNDENLIRAALSEWQAAFCAKDVDRLVALYAPDAVCFDAIPPFSEGVENFRRKIVDCLPYFPEQFALETRDLTLALGSDLACAHFLWHFTDVPPGHPAGRHWLRSSIVWRKQTTGRWLIVHDHCSAPFDPYTEKTVLSPDVSAAGETSAGGCGGANFNPVGWFEIYVNDMERAKAFYAAVFDFAFTRLESPIDLWAFPMQPASSGASGALARMEGFAAGDNSVIVYFNCADCAVQATRAAESGGEIVKAKFAIGPYGHIALVKDTEGNIIGLHSMH